MADYSRYLSCRCNYYGPHRLGCPEHPLYAVRKFALDNNLSPVYDEGFITHYLCDNGCGCLVHDIRAHMRFAHTHLSIKE